MLGPALTRLFKELDSRGNEQTSYEKRLYQELLVLGASAEEFPKNPLGRASERPDLSDLAGRLRGPESLRGIAGVVIDSQDDDDDDVPRLQINCDYENCPNREFK